MTSEIPLPQVAGSEIQLQGQNYIDFDNPELDSMGRVKYAPSNIETSLRRIWVMKQVNRFLKEKEGE